MASAASAAQRPTQRSRTLCAFVVPTPWSCVVADSHEDVSRQDDRVLSFDTKTRHVKVAAAKDTDAAAHAFCDVLPASLRERWIGEPVWGDGITTQEGAGTKRLLLRPSHIFCPVARAREGVAASVAALASSPHFLDQAALAVASGLDAVMYIEGALLSHATLLGLSDGDESKPPEYRGYKRAFTPLEQTITNQSAFSVEPVPPEAPEKRPYVGGHASVAITVGEFTVACLFAYLAEGAANVAPLNDENGVGKLAAHPTIMTHIAAAAATQGGPRLGDVASLGLLPIAIGRIMTTLTLPSISASESWSPVPGSSYSIQLAFHCIQQGEMLSLVRRESDGSAVMDGTSTAQRYEFVSDVENVKRPETPTNDPLVSSPLCLPAAQSPPAPAITPYQSTNEVALAEPETSWISVRTVEDVATLCRIAKAARRTESKHFGKTPSNHVIVVQCRVRQFVLPADVAASATITNKVGSQALIMSSTMTFVSGAAVTSRVHLTNPASQPLRVLQNTLRARTSINMDTNFLKNITQSPLTQIMSRALTGRALLFSAVLAEATEPEMTVDNLTSSARNVSMLAHPPWKRDRAAPRVYGVCHMLERVSKAEYLARLSIVEFECRAWEMLLKDGNKTCACKAVMLL